LASPFSMALSNWVASLMPQRICRGEIGKNRDDCHGHFVRQITKSCRECAAIPRL
jgi:hypothetical protein